MSTARFLFVAVVVTTAPAIGEQLNRHEIIEDVVANIRFNPDPEYGEAISEAEQAAIRAELSVYARSVDFIPEVIKELPPGTRAAILGRWGLHLISADREYCLAAMKARLMSQVANAYGARLIPQLSETDQKRLLGLVEEVVSSVRRSLIAYAGEYLTEAEIDQYLNENMRAAAWHWRDPTSLAFKRIPHREEMQAIAVDYESRLAGAQPRLKERAERLLQAPDSDDVERRHKQFRSMVESELIRPLVWTLSQETSLDAAPFKSEVRRLLPGCAQAQERFSELSYQKSKAETDRRMAAYRKRHEAELEAFKRRMNRPLAGPPVRWE